MADLNTNSGLLAQAIDALAGKTAGGGGGIGGSGTDGCLALFNGPTSLTAGPAINVAGNVGKYLTGDGTWQAFPTAGKNTLGLVKTTSSSTGTSGLTACPIIDGVVYFRSAAATPSAPGWMSAADKNALDSAITYNSQGDQVYLYADTLSSYNLSELYIGESFEVIYISDGDGGYVDMYQLFSALRDAGILD